MTRVLVTGAFGQIGSELTLALRAKHGEANVLATGRTLPSAADAHPLADGALALDVTDAAALEQFVRDHRIDVIYHLAARLSALGEADPQNAWEINMDGLLNVLEAARHARVHRVFWPSSIAVFGPETPRENVPQETVMRPTTIYGVSKVAGELLCDYYVRKYRLDVRGVRYPGVISNAALPGGGTTDYAVEMFYGALRSGRYTAFVREDCMLPMIYMPDCIDAAMALMDAEPGRLRHRNAFNLTAMSFTTGELAGEIRKHLPGFVCTFEPDERQAIADSWPRSIDDRAAREQWGWAPAYDLSAMTTDMLEKLRERIDVLPS